MAQDVAYSLAALWPGLQLDEIILGGGNVKCLQRASERMPGGRQCRTHFVGGFRMWEEDHLPRVPRNKAFRRRKKSSPHQNRKTRLIQKNPLKGAAA